MSGLISGGQTSLFGLLVLVAVLNVRAGCAVVWGDGPLSGFARWLTHFMHCFFNVRVNLWWQERVGWLSGELGLGFVHGQPVYFLFVACSVVRVMLLLGLPATVVVGGTWVIFKVA